MSSARSTLPAEVIDGKVQISRDNPPTLTQSQSKEAHGTNIHSLRMYEQLIMSGEMSMKEMLQALEFLAKYQFQEAAKRITTKPQEKSVDDYLKELDACGAP